MASKFDDFALTALELLTEFGADAVVTRTLPGTFDPVTQAESSSSEEHTFKAVGLPPGKSAEYRVGTLENRNVLEFYLAQRGQTIEPKNGDAVQWKEQAWTIFWSTTYDPAADGAILTVAYAER